MQRATWGRRFAQVRGFATWLSAIDVRTEIPPKHLLDARRRRNTPHIYTEQEISLLMLEAQHLHSRTGLRALTYTTLIGLLVATGLRPGEALALNRSDVDLVSGILSIRDTKFGKSRFVPVEESTRMALVRYARMRDEICSLRLPNDASMGLSSFSRRTRSRHLWPHLIRQHGLGAGITRCCWLPLKPDCAITNLPRSNAKM